MNYYKEKMDFHLEQYQLAIDANKEKGQSPRMPLYSAVAVNRSSPRMVLII